MTPSLNFKRCSGGKWSEAGTGEWSLRSMFSLLAIKSKGCSVPAETAANCRFQTWLTLDRPSAETPGQHTREPTEWYDC